jgi:endonuclease/exonuclease/phosphatase family metal-dependent hydrolase
LDSFNLQVLVMINKSVFFVILPLVFGLAFPIFSKMQEAVNPLRVTTCNIGDLDGRHADLDRVVHVLSREPSPDVVLLQEVRGEAAVASIARRLGMHSYIYANYKNRRRYGLAIVSKKSELQNPEIYHFNESQDSRGVLFAQLPLGTEWLTLASIHLDRIEKVETGERVDISLREALELLEEEMTQETVRSRCVRELLGWLPLRYENRLIVGGDFNTVPLTRAIRLMNHRFKDVLWPSIDFFRGSFAKTSLAVLPRLDYIFHTPDLVCRDASIVQETAGDHRPITAVFDF